VIEVNRRKHEKEDSGELAAAQRRR
jgi:hypothetical protein